MTRFLRPLLVALLLLPAGCQVLGIAANAMPKPPVPAKVVLAGNTVGVMVWCDRGLRIDWPSLQKDLANGVQVRIAEAVKAKAKEVAGVSFPFPVESFIRWQKDHPGSEAQPITSVAAQLRESRITRLIYVEVQSLSTRSSSAMALYRGTATASLKVIAIEPDATVGKIIYEEPNIRVVFPKHSTDDGRAEGNDNHMYAGTMTFLADAIAKRFVEHPAEDD